MCWRTINVYECLKTLTARSSIRNLLYITVEMRQVMRFSCPVYVMGSNDLDTSKIIKQKEVKVLYRVTKKYSMKRHLIRIHTKVLPSSFTIYQEQTVIVKHQTKHCQLFFSKTTALTSYITALQHTKKNVVLTCKFQVYTPSTQITYSNYYSRLVRPFLQT